MAWNDGKIELTEKQKEMAMIAGIPADRPGLGAEYPKAVYHSGAGPQLLGEPFKIDGRFAVDTATVANADEEGEALAQGWTLTADPEAEQARRDALDEKDAEIAALKAQLAGNEAPRRGRPPKIADENEVL